MSGDRLSIHDQAQPMRRDTLLGAARQRREKLARLRRFLWVPRQTGRDPCASPRTSRNCVDSESEQRT